MDYMILLDRQVDPLSPLVTQLTYEGLIDEFFGISNSKFMFATCTHCIVFMAFNL